MEEEFVDYENGHDESVYSEEARGELLEDDEITSEEEGFMQGYENPDVAKCAFCHKPLIDPESVVERVINGQVHYFCSEECAEEYERDLQ